MMRRRARPKARSTTMAGIAVRALVSGAARPCGLSPRQLMPDKLFGLLGER